MQQDYYLLAVLHLFALYYKKAGDKRCLLLLPLQQEIP